TVVTGLRRGGGKVARRGSGEVGPRSKASRARKGDVREGRRASSRILACMVRRDVPKASEIVVVRIEEVEADSRRVGVPRRRGDVLEALVQDRCAQLRNRGAPRGVQRVS